MTKKLEKYWFRFVQFSEPTALNLGCGVSAHSLQDAINIMREYIFGDNGPPEIIEQIEQIELDSLEKNHVLPNIGNVAIRGVWFPQGYETRKYVLNSGNS